MEGLNILGKLIIESWNKGGWKIGEIESRKHRLVKQISEMNTCFHAQFTF